MNPTLYSKIEGQGQPLLIMHGFLGMSDNWNTLSGQYVEHGFEVHALDLRNHGRSFQSEEFTYASMVQDVYDYCSTHQLSNIDLMGHSMGGKVAMFFAMQHPEMLNKLIIADIAPRYYEPHHQDIITALSAVDFSKKPSRSEVDAILGRYISDSGTRQFLMKSLYWVEPGQLGFRFNLEVFKRKIAQVGQALPPDTVYKKPTLFLRGARSGYIDKNDEIDIGHYFPDSKIETISNAGHWLHAENPTEFLEKTLEFLK